MLEILQTTLHYFTYPFVLRALFVGLMVALSSSLLGTTLIMRRLSYMGDGLSHVAFGAFAIAMVAGVSSNIFVVTPITLIAAFLILRRGQAHDTKGDAVLAMVSAGALSIGYLLMNVFGTSSNITGDIHSILFGSTALLTLSNADVALAMLMTLGVVVAFIWLYNRIFAITFDEGFSAVSGLAVGRVNIVLAAMISLVIVSGMSLVGALLMSALIVFPAMSALKLKNTFKGVTIASAIISLVTMLGGIFISIAASTPVGATVVALDIVVFLVATLVPRFPK